MLGDCLKLTEMDADIFGPGTWDAESGIYTSAFPAYGVCAGGTTGEYYANLRLTAHACGTIRVTATGIGYKNGGPQTYLSVSTLIALYGPGDGASTDLCEVGPMLGDGVVDVALDCGQQFDIGFYRGGYYDGGETSVTVTLEVLGTI